MTTTHKMRAWLPIDGGDDEIEVEIAFTHLAGSSDYYNKAGGHWEQGWGAEVEFVSVAPLSDGKYYDAGATPLEWLDDFARAWLESDEGYKNALASVCDDYEAGREHAAELRKDR